MCLYGNSISSDDELLTSHITQMIDLKQIRMVTGDSNQIFLTDSDQA